MDKEFKGKAVRLIEERTTYFKSIVSLTALLEAGYQAQSPLSAEAQSNIGEAKKINRDNSGSIATAWNNNLRAAFGAA